MTTVSNHAPSEIIAEIDGLLASDYFGENYEHGKGKIEPVGLARYAILKRIREFLLKKRFPETDDECAQLSLVPYVFQEANYDSIPWTEQHENLWQLQPFFDIDYMVQNHGMDRVDATEQQFNAYAMKSLEIVKKIR